MSDYFLDPNFFSNTYPSTENVPLDFNFNQELTFDDFVNFNDDFSNGDGFAFPPFDGTNGVSLGDIEQPVAAPVIEPIVPLAQEDAGVLPGEMSADQVESEIARLQALLSTKKSPVQPVAAPMTPQMVHTGILTPDATPSNAPTERFTESFPAPQVMMSPPSFNMGDHMAMSVAQNHTTEPTTTSSPAAKTARKAPASSKPRKSTTINASKVTKPKHSRKRNASASTIPTAKEPERELTMAELHNSRFVALSYQDRCRLLLPLLQGLDPVTGERVSAEGTLLSWADNASNASNNNLAMQNMTALPPVPERSYPSPPMNQQSSAAKVLTGPATAREMMLARQAAMELTQGGGAAGRQSDALMRAEMLGAAGRRR